MYAKKGTSIFPFDNPKLPCYGVAVRPSAVMHGFTLEEHSGLSVEFEFEKNSA
jgi:hypothetical protein